MGLLEQFKRTNLPAALRVIDESGEVAEMVSLRTDVIQRSSGICRPKRPGPMIVKRDDGSWLLDGTLGLATMVRNAG